MSSFSNNSVDNFRLDSKLYPAYIVLSNSIKNGFLIITKVILQQINAFIKVLSISLDFNLLTFVFSKLSVVCCNSERGLVFLFLFFSSSINMKLINFLWISSEHFKQCLAKWIFNFAGLAIAQNSSQKVQVSS